jgi:hypothetical protein
MSRNCSLVLELTRNTFGCWSEIPAVIHRSHLKRTVGVALLVGSVLPEISIRP